MSFSYEPGASDKDTVRLLVGDTDPDKRQLHDEEIAWFLTENSNVYLAAAEAAKAIAALYGRDVDKQVGDLKISASQRQKQYLDLAKQLRSRVGRSISPYAGGISRSDKIAVEQDTDRVRPAFRRNQFDNPGTVDPPGSTSGWHST
jgi:hypothetical protein